MVLGINPNTLQILHTDSSLTEAASGVVYRPPNLRNLSVIIERCVLLLSASLPNLTNLEITCDNEGDWPWLFQGATLGKLESVTFNPRFKQIGDFLEAFERAALSSSVQDILSRFDLYAPRSWNPNYSPLLSFTRLVDLVIEPSCRGGCSWTADDDIVINLARAMPKLETLALGDLPCRRFATGVTTKGLVALAQHCQNLFTLCIHFQVASLAAPPPIPQISPNPESTASWTDRALMDFTAGEIRVPEQSALMVVQTLARNLSRIGRINYSEDERWEEVEEAIWVSRQPVDRSRSALETDG